MAGAFSAEPALAADAAQVAEIIGIRQEAEVILARQNRLITDDERHRFNSLRAKVLRRIFEAVLQVQSAENQLELEMAYAYDVLARERRKTNTVNEFFNVFNFAQLSVLYGFIEPYSRLKNQFTQSAVGTCVGSGMAIGLPVLNILYNKFAKASHLAPPPFLAHILEGKPVDASNLPPLVAGYMDSPAAGSSLTRRQALNELWKERYHADMSKKDTLCGLDDGKSKNAFVLNTRTVLLWSLYTAIKEFDSDLLSLLNQVKQTLTAEAQPSPGRIAGSLGLEGGAEEAARLLRLEATIRELQAAPAGSEQKKELEITFMESLLAGYLEIRVAADRCQQDLNYQYDVVLAQMNARRGKFLQKTYELNFIQTGTLGACAGWSYLKGYSKAGNELFIIADSIGLGITAISLLGTHGGWRKNHTEPNSLADFFDLRASGKHGFTPFVWSYLNSVAPARADGKSRRQYLQEIWSKHGVTTYNLNKKASLEKLGSMPSCKWDTINLVTNRIALLSSLREQFLQFDTELLDLLRNAWPEQIAGGPTSPPAELNQSAAAAATLLGVGGMFKKMPDGSLDENAKLTILRQVLEGFLDANANSNIIAHEMLVESQVVDRMTRQRDKAIQLTNLGNFLQLGILGVVSDSMGLSSSSKYVLYADRINIVSGYLIGSLALASVLEKHGSVRLSRVGPNSLTAAFGKGSAKLSPLMIKYLNSVAPVSTLKISRREELKRYWTESKVLSVNVNRDANVQKLSVEGRAHHWWDETISMINNRITMLYDLRAVLRSSNQGFEQLLGSLN